MSFCPEDAGLKRAKTEDILSTGDLRAEANRFVTVLSGKNFPACVDFTCLNAGTILCIAGKCSDLKAGAEMSREAMESGRALAKLHEWAAVQGTCEPSI